MYMLLDILYAMKNSEDMYSKFAFEDPIKFIRENVYYILVCSKDKNPQIYEQIKNCEISEEKNYTPPFMERLRDYIFKDAYVYTEFQLEHKFVKAFEY